MAVVMAAPVISGCSSTSDPSPSSDSTQGASSSNLLFYDWEENLLGPAKDLLDPDPSVSQETLHGEQLQKWIGAGRLPTEGFNRLLISEGAEPSRDAAHELAAVEESAGRAPQGAIVVTEQAVDLNGRPTGEPGYFVLNNDPALTGADIRDPLQETDSNGSPNVTFSFSDKGQKAFQDVTRQIAERGLAKAIGPVDAVQAAALSDHIAIVFGGKVLSRPIVNFAENPDGIEGRTGMQVTGGLNLDGAKRLAQELRTQDDSPTEKDRS